MNATTQQPLLPGEFRATCQKLALSRTDAARSEKERKRRAGFGAKTVEPERCDFATDDPEEFVKHMAEVHKTRSAFSRPSWLNPKPYPKPRIKDNPTALVAIASSLPITWVDDLGTVRTGQFWADAPGKGRIWVIPDDREASPGVQAIQLEHRRAFDRNIGRWVGDWHPVARWTEESQTHWHRSYEAAWASGRRSV